MIFNSVSDDTDNFSSCLSLTDKALPNLRQQKWASTPSDPRPHLSTETPFLRRGMRTCKNSTKSCSGIKRFSHTSGPVPGMPAQPRKILASPFYSSVVNKKENLF